MKKSIKLKGSSFLFKYFYSRSHLLLKLPMVHCVDTWKQVKDNGKLIYVVRLKFKKFGQ